MDGTEKLDEDRVFLHDLCNFAAVVLSSIQIVILKAQKTPPDITLPEAVIRLEKAQKSMEKLVTLVSNRRTVIAQNSDAV